MMRGPLCLMLMGLLTAQDLVETRSRYPQAKKPFHLTYEDIRDTIDINKLPGKVLVEFYIDEHGRVVDPIVIDSFLNRINAVVIDKLKETEYHPATQNGRAITVRYTLPIVFK